MRDKVKLITSDGFLKNNIIFFCGSLFAAVFNYLYHPILGRIMSVEEFGEVQTLVSLFTELMIITGVFRIIVVNIVSNETRENPAKETISMLHKIALYFILILSALIIIFSSYLKAFFRFDSVYPFAGLAFAMMMSLMLGFRESVLQGLNDFKSVSISQTLNSSGKLIFAVLLVYLGWSTSGAISALAISQLVAFSYTAPKTRNFFNHAWFRSRIDSRIKKELKYGLLALIVTLSTTFIYTFDVIIVKHYFPSQVAGLYSGISIIARIIFFITSSVVGVLLPAVKMGDASGQNGKILKKSLLLIFALSGTTFLFFSLFPGFVINTLIGSRYLAYSNLLPRLSMVLFLASLINVLSYYMLALREYRIAAVSVLGILAISIASFFRHGSLIEIIDNFLFGAVAITASLLFLYSKLYSKSKFLKEYAPFKKWLRVSRRF